MSGAAGSVLLWAMFFADVRFRGTPHDIDETHVPHALRWDHMTFASGKQSGGDIIAYRIHKES